MDLIATTTVGKDPQEVYAYWRALTHLPDFMAHVEDVRPDSDARSHWRVSAPFGRTVEWDAEIIEDVPGEILAWRSVEGADVANAGIVRFSRAPRDQGTELRVTISYDVPGGKLGEALARWGGEDPHQQLDDDLRRFKQVMETGEVVRSEGAPWGKRARKEFPQHAARPLTDDEVIDLTGEEVHA
ncbi:MAG: SRPBCC family protein [Frankiaceae bacterium]